MINSLCYEIDLTVDNLRNMGKLKLDLYRSINKKSQRN